MLYETDNVVFPGRFDESSVVGKQLSRRFGDKDMNAAFNCIDSNGIVGT